MPNLLNTEQMVNDTINQIRGIYQKSLKKAASVTTGSGLVNYDLQAPAKNLYPVLTPLRNDTPRVTGRGGTATNWKVVTSIVGSGYGAMGWVPEGQRSGKMAVNTASKAATYVTLGEEISASFEAVNAARDFEDEKARNVVRGLQQMMLKEEHALFGGNNSVALGTTPTPTTSASGTDGTISAATYSVICVALTYEGYHNYSGNIATGLVQSQTITGQDGATYTLNGGYGQKSAAASQAVAANQSLFATVSIVNGAVAYAWYVGAAGSEKLQTITTINSVKFTALTTTGQLASALTATDNSTNNTAFDGYMYATYAAYALGAAQIYRMGNGVAGTGTKLTSSGRGSISEIDSVLQAMWTNYQVAPNVMYVNAQEVTSMANAVLNASGSPLVRFNLDQSTQNPTLTGGTAIGTYFNPYTAEGGSLIPIKLHPKAVPGTIVLRTNNLPVQYQSSEVPNVAEVHTRQDYYEIDWPQTTREYRWGVYAEEVLAVYAPFCEALVTNIAAG